FSGYGRLYGSFSRGVNQGYSRHSVTVHGHQSYLAGLLEASIGPERMGIHIVTGPTIKSIPVGPCFVLRLVSRHHLSGIGQTLLGVPAIQGTICQNIEGISLTWVGRIREMQE